jgi:hypothetical protein
VASMSDDIGLDSTYQLVTSLTADGNHGLWHCMLKL